MAKLLKLRRGTTTQHGSFTGAEGEVTVDTDKETLVVHDGSTAGGHPVAAEDMANVSSASIAGRLANDSIAVGKIAAGTLPSDVKIQDANVSGNLTIESADIVDGTIVNADVNASAAIAGTKISPNFGSQNVVTTGNVTLSDSSAGGNNRLAFGASGDLQVWHDGSNSYLADEGTGALRILGSAIQLKNVANNEIGLEFTENGAVDLYYDNSKKLQTQSGGVRVFGDLENHNDDFVAKDNCKFIAGNSNDLQMYHDGTNSYLLNQVGNLEFYINASEVGAKIIPNGAVELYHDNSKRFETTSGGASVTGNLDVSSGVDVTGNITVSGTVDGRDIAADANLLLGVTQATGVIHDSVTTDTPSAGDNSTHLATTAFVQTAIANLVDSSPSALNTLNELAAAINDDANFSTTITNSIATKMPLAGGTFTGAVTGTTFADSKGDVRSIPLNSKSSSYTLTLADAGKAIYISSGGVTIPSSVMAAGNAVTIVNDSGSNQTITQGSGLTLYNTADAATGNRTLLPRGITTVWFAATATAYISGSGLE